MEMDIFQEVANHRRSGIHIVREGSPRSPNTTGKADHKANLAVANMTSHRCQNLRGSNRNAASSFWLKAKWYCNIRYWKQAIAASSIYSTVFILCTYLVR